MDVNLRGEACFLLFYPLEVSGGPFSSDRNVQEGERSGCITEEKKGDGRGDGAEEVRGLQVRSQPPPPTNRHSSEEW